MKVLALLPDGVEKPSGGVGEQFREHLQHRFPVLQHVGDTGRCAGIVLQHEKLVLAGADEVHPDDVGENPAGRRDAQHLRQESVVILDQRRRNAGLLLLPLRRGLADAVPAVVGVQAHEQVIAQAAVGHRSAVSEGPWAAPGSILLTPARPIIPG